MALVTQPMKSRSSGAPAHRPTDSSISAIDHNRCGHPDDCEHGRSGWTPRPFPPSHAQRTGNGSDHVRRPVYSGLLPSRRVLIDCRPDASRSGRNCRYPDENPAASGLRSEDHDGHSGRGYRIHVSGSTAHAGSRNCAAVSLRPAGSRDSRPWITRSHVWRCDDLVCFACLGIVRCRPHRACDTA